MSTPKHNDRNAEQTQTGKEIQESIDRAQVAINRLDNIAKRQAMGGNNPYGPEYWDALIDVDAAVMDAYNRIRKYLRVDEDRYWNEYIIAYDEGCAVVLGGEDGDNIDVTDLEPWGQLPSPELLLRDGEMAAKDLPIRYFEYYEGAVESKTVTERPRFGTEQEVTRHYPKLLEPADYRRALRVMDEARRKLGFTPTPTESDPRTEITREMIDDVTEWREENLPEEYLNNGHNEQD